MEESLTKIVIGTDKTYVSLSIDRRTRQFFIALKSTIENEKKEEHSNEVELFMNYDEAAALSNTISAWLSARG